MADDEEGKQSPEAMGYFVTKAVTDEMYRRGYDAGYARGKVAGRCAGFVMPYLMNLIIHAAVSTGCMVVAYWVMLKI